MDKYKITPKKFPAEFCEILPALQSCSDISVIVAQVSAAKIDRTALIIVGNCLNKNYEKSQLYSPNFSHMFRKGGLNG